MMRSDLKGQAEIYILHTLSKDEIKQLKSADYVVLNNEATLEQVKRLPFIKVVILEPHTRDELLQHLPKNLCKVRVHQDISARMLKALARSVLVELGEYVTPAFVEQFPNKYLGVCAFTSPSVFRSIRCNKNIKVVRLDSGMSEKQLAEAVSALTGHVVLSSDSYEVQAFIQKHQAKLVEQKTRKRFASQLDESEAALKEMQALNRTYLQLVKREENKTTELSLLLKAQEIKQVQMMQAYEERANCLRQFGVNATAQMQEKTAALTQRWIESVTELRKTQQALMVATNENSVIRASLNEASTTNNELRTTMVQQHRVAENSLEGSNSRLRDRNADQATLIKQLQQELLNERLAAQNAQQLQAALRASEAKTQAANDMIRHYLSTLLDERQRLNALHSSRISYQSQKEEEIQGLRQVITTLNNDLQTTDVNLRAIREQQAQAAQLSEGEQRKLQLELKARERESAALQTQLIAANTQITELLDEHGADLRLMAVAAAGRAAELPKAPPAPTPKAASRKQARVEASTSPSQAGLYSNRTRAGREDEEAATALYQVAGRGSQQNPNG